MSVNKHYVAAFTAFTMWGFFSLALKPVHDYASLDILFYRVLYASALLLLINLLFRKTALRTDIKTFRNLEKKQRNRIVALTLVGGFLLVVNWFLFIYAVNHVSLKSASFAYLLCPILTTILAYFILKEKLSRWQWIAVAISLVSCVLLSFGDFTGLLFSLIIAFTFAWYLITQRKNNQFDRFVVLTVQMVMASVVILPFFPSYSGDVPAEPLFWILITCIVVLFTIIPLFLNLYALKGMNAAAVGILMYINPLINFLLAVFYFKEAVNELQVVAYMLILISVLIFNERHLRYKSKRAIGREV